MLPMLFWNSFSCCIKYIRLQNDNIQKKAKWHLVFGTYFPNTENRHDDVTKWKHFPRYWSFLRGIHWSPVNSPHKGQWHGALIFSLIGVWIDWVNNGEAGDLRRYRAHYDVSVMESCRHAKFFVNLGIDKTASNEKVGIMTTLGFSETICFHFKTIRITPMWL